MKIKKISKKVLYSKENITRVNWKDINLLKKMALKNKSKIIRLCTHKNSRDLLHEMLIVHPKGYYVWPHKHLYKTESFHITEGKVDILIFNNRGKIVDCISMGSINTQNFFYYRLPPNNYHTLLIKSDILVFHEITKGPFYKKDTIYAPWAPNGNNKLVVKRYLDSLRLETEAFKKRKHQLILKN